MSFMMSGQGRPVACDMAEPAKADRNETSVPVTVERSSKRDRSGHDDRGESL